MGKKRKTLEKYGVIHYECSHCLHFKPHFEFATNNNSLDGIQWTCRECLKTKWRMKKQEQVSGSTPLQESYSEHNKEIIREILLGMEYDLSKPVSEQFYERVKQKYNKDLS